MSPITAIFGQGKRIWQWDFIINPDLRDIQYMEMFDFKDFLDDVDMKWYRYFFRCNVTMVFTQKYFHQLDGVVISLVG